MLHLHRSLGKFPAREALAIVWCPDVVQAFLLIDLLLVLSAVRLETLGVGVFVDVVLVVELGLRIARKFLVRYAEVVDWVDVITVGLNGWGSLVESDVIVVLV